LPGARLAFPRAHRLQRAQEFSVVMKGGCRTRDEYFNVYAAPNRLPHARVGLTVSRRVSTKAVIRNRVKRAIRESFRRHQEALVGLSMVVVVQTPAATAGSERLRESLRQHWERIAKRCKPS
jgi:ribonuclease P protein component